ncbi:alpha/beta fold hydrolase [Ferrovibrio sp.]|uniref:alpha/beta fold hydrolase n=1 Tax=Ferrovibrio sp. TaxID=1917215 RepID=UPI003D0E31CC
MAGTGKSHLLASALLLPLLGGLLAGCADGGGLFQSNAARADAVAREANPPLTKTLINTQGFDIVAYYRQGAPNDPRLAVFIEGDGVAYISRYQRAYDPTPEKPVALQLAARHPAPNILYLARPCQFTGGNKARNCDSAYWTSHRFAPEAITAMNQALDTYLRHSGAREVTLYGYSGGAMVALLLAGQRRDVAAMVTVAGMLDHQAWTSHFGDTPLYGSRNSLEVADALRRLPQRHFIGDRDKQVPPGLTAPFLRRIGLRPEAFITELRDTDHDCCWADLWPQLSRMAPVQP